MKLISLIQGTPEEFQKPIIEEIKKEIEKLKKEFQPKKATEYITLQQGADLLQVDLSSINNWRKKHVLKGYGIMGRVLLKRSEVEAALVELKPHSKKSNTTNK